MVAPLPLGAQAGWGARGQGPVKANCDGTALSASWEAAVFHVGKIDCHCYNGGLVPPHVVTEIAASSGVAGNCDGEGTAVLQRRRCGGQSQQHPHASRGATAAVNAMAFLQGWASLFVGKEEVLATMAVAMSLSWQQQERAEIGLTRAGGGRRRTR